MKTVFQVFFIGATAIVALLVAGAHGQQATSPSGSKGVSAPEPVDPAVAKEAARRLREALDQPLPELIRAAGDLAIETRAAIEFDPLLTTLSTRKALYEQLRADCLDQAQVLERQRKEMIDDLNKEREQIRLQLQKEPEEAKKQEGTVIRAYLPRLEGLKKRQDQMAGVLKETELGLRIIQGQVTTLERERRLYLRGLAASGTLTPYVLPPLSGSILTPLERAPADKPVEDPRTLEDLERRLKELVE